MNSKPKTPTGSATSRSDPANATGPAILSRPQVLFKHILVPIDFSDCSLRALDYGLALALACDAKLTLLHVVEPAVYQADFPGVTPPLEETNQSLVKTSHERLAALSRKRVDARISSQTLVRMGRAHSEIPDTAKALGVDLIVMGTHGYTGLKHMLLGSTAERVVRQASCPVLTVRSGKVDLA